MIIEYRNITSLDIGLYEATSEDMKLYATVESERAKKAQGGNKFLRIVLKIGYESISRIVATVIASVNGDDVTVTYFDPSKRDATKHQYSLRKGASDPD